MANNNSELTLTHHILLHFLQTTGAEALDKAINLSRQSTSMEKTKTWPAEKVLAIRRDRLGEELRALVENSCDVAAALEKEIATRKKLENSLADYKTTDMALLVDLIRTSGEPHAVEASIVIQHLRSSLAGHSNVESPWAFLSLFEGLDPENRHPLGWDNQHDALTRIAVDKAVVAGVRKYGADI